MLPNAKVGDFPSTGGPGGAKRVLGSGCRVLAYASQSVEWLPAPSTQNPEPARAWRPKPLAPLQNTLSTPACSGGSMRHGRAQQRLGPRDGAARNEVRERVAHYRHTRILNIRAPFWRAPAPTSHYGVQTSMFPIPYRCTPAKKPPSLPPAKSPPLSPPPAVLGLGGLTQLTRHFG